MPAGFQIKLQNAKVEVVESWLREHETAMMVSDLEELVAVDLGLLDEMRTLWQDVRRTIQAGDVRDYDAVGKELQTHFKGCLAHLLSFMAEVKRFRDKLGEPIHGLDELARAIVEFQGLYERIFEMWPWRDRPWPPLDKEMVARSRNETGENVEDILARLKAGESLLKE